MSTQNKNAANAASSANGVNGGTPSTNPETSNFTVGAGGTVSKTDAKPVVVKTETPKPPVQEKKTLSIADRLKMLEKLNRLNERRVDLVEALDDVTSFILSPASPAKITFIDAKNHSFSVSHQGVIAEMIELAKKRLESEIEKVDSQITFE